MRKLRLLSITIFLLLSVALVAQTFSKATYYRGANGKKKAELKTALYGIIKNPSVKSYSNLWTYYYQTDRRENNTVIDRYSNTTRYFGNKGQTVSDMDKEHSFPKSWWGGTDVSTPAYSDLHHLMPSDHTANNRKSSYGLGLVTGTVSFENGSCKVGAGKAGSSNATLFEPADEWKGDFARIYFYMVTCYEELDMLKNDEAKKSMQAGTYPKLQEWAYNLYLKWSREDPVDDIERARNDSVYKIQGNRNPYIDFEGLEQYIWGTHMAEAFNASAYANPFDGTIPDPDPDPDPEPQPVASGDYVKVTTAPEDWSGTYLIVCEGESVAMNGALEPLDAVGDTIVVTISDGVIADSEKANAAAFTIAKIEGGYSIQSQNGQYIGQTSDANGLLVKDSELLNTISIGGEGYINILGSGGAYLRFNAAVNQVRFRYYKSSTYTSQKPIALYIKTKALIKGDLNGDGSVTIADVTALVNIILGRTEVYDVAVADVTGDGEVTIADVTALVNIILGRTNE